MQMTRVMVTGSGGLAGVNFVRALRASSTAYYIVGTDFNMYHLLYPEVDARYLTPRHSDKSFIPRIVELAKKEKVVFLHPQPSSEAYVISSKRERVPCKIFLPPASVMRVGQDKLLSERRLKAAGIPVAKTAPIKNKADIPDAFSELGNPLWARARHGAGGRLSLLCGDATEARLWIELWVKRGGVGFDEFILQEYLPGRNIAWDSIWKDGRLVTSYSRERLEYPFKHVSPSGITGTPSVSRIIHDPRLNEVCRRAVKAIDGKPDGAYSVDVKESASGSPCITEVDSGKFHSTMPLWGYIAVKHLGLPEYANLADLYVRLGMGEEVDEMPPQTDLLPDGYYLLRDMDVGAYLWREDDGSKLKVL
jgi:glutathione synthase/RimK-type ligase-like ATP-grasp enzyme